MPRTLGIALHVVFYMLYPDTSVLLGGPYRTSLQGAQKKETTHLWLNIPAEYQRFLAVPDDTF